MTNAIVRRADDAVAAPLDGTLLLLNVEAGCYHALNPVASRIWELIERPIDREAIVDRLRAEFAVDAERCRQEVDDFLEQLAERGLLATE